MLEKIIRHKIIEISVIKKSGIKSAEKNKTAENSPPRRHLFLNTLRKNRFSVIAEIKRKSPSAGWIRRQLEPVGLAREYAAAGAAAISVLTEKKFFGARPTDIVRVKKAVKIPVLKKDFIIDETQIWQAFREGADALLLIAAVLPLQKLKKFLSLSQRLGLDCLVEVHTAGELKKVLRTKAEIIGINNRNLKNGRVDLAASIKLGPLIPRDKIMVSESGIKTGAETARLKKLGFRAVLVGEGILRSKKMAVKIRELKKGG